MSAADTGAADRHRLANTIAHEIAVKLDLVLVECVAMICPLALADVLVLCRWTVDAL